MNNSNNIAFPAFSEAASGILRLTFAVVPLFIIITIISLPVLPLIPIS